MNRKLKTYGAELIGDYIWFSNNTFNGLFRMNIYNYVIDFVQHFPDEGYALKCMHKKCIKIDNKLVFLPSMGKHIHIFDVLTGKFETIEYPFGTQRNDFDKFGDAILIGRNIYIFPISIEDDLIEFNVDNYHIQVVQEFKNQIIKMKLSLGNLLLTRISKDKDDIIHFAFFNTNIVAKWDSIRKKLIISECKIKNIFSAHFINEYIWLLQNDSNLVYRIDSKGNIKEFQNNEKIGEKRAYNRIIEFKGRMILIPAFGNKLYEIRDNLNVITTINKNDEDIPCSFDVCVVDEKLWVLPFGIDECYIIDDNLAISQKISFEIGEELKNKLIKDYYVHDARDIVFESQDFGIQELIGALV